MALALGFSPFTCLLKSRKRDLNKCLCVKLGITQPHPFRNCVVQYLLSVMFFVGVLEVNRRCQMSPLEVEGFPKSRALGLCRLESTAVHLW